ncbi:MAG: YqaJ viral recombinase family protein [Rhodospirillaceae bacterium]|nr:YqaJ viral recombinase family protein [Rhodospirillaceae bacterium]
MIIHEAEQRSDEWRALRSGVPTASAFSKLVTSKGEPSKSSEEYARSLAAEAFSGIAELDAWTGSQFSNRGQDLEDEAVAYYQMKKNIRVERVGFVTNNEGSAGCSPDGLVGKVGMVEIKCLKAENHIKTIMYLRKNKKCPTTYVPQTQGQMMLCERKWCDILFYHPHLPSLIIRQKPDEKIYEALQQEIKNVCSARDGIMKVLKTI